MLLEAMARLRQRRPGACARVGDGPEADGCARARGGWAWGAPWFGGRAARRVALVRRARSLRHRLAGRRAAPRAAGGHGRRAARGGQPGARPHGRRRRRRDRAPRAPADAAALAAAADAFLADGARGRMGEAARERVASEFSAARMAAEVADVYRRAAASLRGEPHPVAYNCDRLASRDASERSGAPMRLLITGITGFVGSHMAEFALAHGAEVFGSIRWRSKTENIDHLRARITLVECDLRDLSSVRNLLEISRAYPRRAPRRPELRGRVVEGAGGDAVHQHHLPGESAGGHARPQDGGPLPRRRQQRGVRLGPSRRAAHQGDESASAAVALRGEQGHAGHDGVPVLQELRAAHRPHARLQSRGTAARRRLRHLQLRPAGRRDRGRPARAGDARGRSQAQARLLRRAGHRPGLLGAAGAGRAGRGLQPLLGQLMGDPAGAGLPARAVAGKGDRGPDRSRAAAALRCDGAGGRSRQDRAGDGLEGRDPVRAHA